MVRNNNNNDNSVPLWRLAIPVRKPITGVDSYPAHCNLASNKEKPILDHQMLLVIKEIDVKFLSHVFFGINFN